jgi:hypothetical protein
MLFKINEKEAASQENKNRDATFGLAIFTKTKKN